MKEENKRLFILLAVVLGIVLFIAISAIASNIKAQKYVDQVKEAFSKKESTLVYLGKDTCSYCALLEPTLKEFQDEYKFDYTYVDTNKANAKLDQILKKFNQDIENFGTPYLAVVKDGKIVKEQHGYAEENELFAFLKETGFIPKEAKLALNYLDYNTYKDKLESSDKQIFVITQTGCSHCENAKPVLKEIAKEYNCNINIVNTTSLSEEEQKKFMESLPYYNEEQWGTPLILVVENKNIIDSMQGFSSKEDYIDFFKKNGYIK